MMMTPMSVWCLIFDEGLKLNKFNRLEFKSPNHIYSLSVWFSSLNHGHWSTNLHLWFTRHCCRGRKLSIHWQVPHGEWSVGMLKWNAKRFVVFTAWMFCAWYSNQLNAWTPRQLEEALRRLDSRVERASATALQSSEGHLVPVASVWLNPEVSSWTWGKKTWKNCQLDPLKNRKPSNNMLQGFHGIL